MLAREVEIAFQTDQITIGIDKIKNSNRREGHPFAKRYESKALTTKNISHAVHPFIFDFPPIAVAYLLLAAPPDH